MSSKSGTKNFFGARGYGDAHDIEVGQRIARSTGSARSQLRSFIDQNGDGPAILAIMDSRALGHAYPHQLAALFEGTLTVDVSVADSSIDVYRREDRRRLPERNRILSAIVVLRLCTQAGPVVRLETESGDPYVIADLLVTTTRMLSIPFPEMPSHCSGFRSMSLVLLNLLRCTLLYGPRIIPSDRSGNVQPRRAFELTQRHCQGKFAGLGSPPTTGN